jgi:hypothetical protein
MNKLACIALLLFSACDRSSHDEPASPPKAAAKVAAKTPTFDDRTPVPLSPMMAAHQKRDMRDHLLVVQEIATALETDDFDAIAASASRIGWSPQQAMKCEHMGAGAPGFAELGEQFHKTADTIAAAAHQRDHKAVAHAVADTLRVCVSCHATYRQDVAVE